jgi:hypothetical protein
LKSPRTTRLLSGIVVTLILSGPCFAQYGGGSTGGGSTAGSYGSGKTVGLGVGAAAAGAGVLYLTLRHRGLVTGCVSADNDGLNLVDEKKHQTYSLMPGRTDLKPGERVQVKGKRSKDQAGTQIFEANSVVKNLGACSTQSAVNASLPSSK